MATYGERCDTTGKLIHTCDCTRHAHTGGLTRDDGWVASGVGDYLDTDPGPLPTTEDHGDSRAADTLIRTASDNIEAMRVFADYCAESAYWWDHYRDDRRRRIAVLVTTLSDRIGITPTRLLGMVNAAGPVPFEKSRGVAPRRYPWAEVDRRFGWTESVVAVYVRST
jgi:hypothetical protein